LLAVCSLIAAPVANAVGQSATLAGAVVRDTLSHGLPGALVAIPQLNRSDTSDATGEFKLIGLPSGRYVATIRRLGFLAMVDTIELINGTSVEREYVMDPTPAFLDSVRVSVAREPERLSARMSEFEAHRKLGYGRYVTEAELRKNDNRKLNDVLSARIPGLVTFRSSPRTQPSAEWLSSGRGACAGPAFSCGGGAPCPVTLYYNGVLAYASGLPGQDVPDMARYPTYDLEAVEYYSGGASLPEQYNATSSGCGVLVLWARER
ncbi:MAG: carboxypeptidase regulatory-like domain-containing protein, partial [Gemmatimonadaceae bacterium]